MKCATGTVSSLNPPSESGVEKSSQTQPSVETKRKKNEKINAGHLTLRGNCNVLAHFPCGRALPTVERRHGGKAVWQGHFKVLTGRRKRQAPEPYPTRKSATRFSRLPGDDGNKEVAAAVAAQRISLEMD